MIVSLAEGWAGSLGSAWAQLGGASSGWPTAEDWMRLITLADYNTRVVVLGTMLLGGAAGMVGSFTLLRKRALMGDALSHATLPGICLAFMLATWWGADGKSLPGLLVGATVTGLLGVATILGIRRWTRLKEDTALGIVLSVFFGGGIALMGIVQQMEAGHAAGLEAFVYGKTASMGRQDIQLIAMAAGGCMLACLLVFKELKLLCFDDGYAGSRGYPVTWLDWYLMGLVVVVCIVGLQAVGLILMIALLVIPAAAARFWTQRLTSLFLVSGGIGAVSGLVGAGISALFSRLPSGAMIVLVCTAVFVVSLLLGSRRGILIRGWQRRNLNRSVARQHLLRALFELGEIAAAGSKPGDGVVPFQQLLHRRSWSARQLRREIRRAEAAGTVVQEEGGVRLTKAGEQRARQLTRQHRLWELYLITHADIAPGRVDRSADAIEHVLEPELVDELEQLLQKSGRDLPSSPHALQATSPEGSG